MKISELSESQKSHLAYRLDHNTYVGYCTAGAIARGEWGDLELEEVFMKADKTKRSAKMLAKKVMDFYIDPDVYWASGESLRVGMQITSLLRELANGNEHRFDCLLDESIKMLTGFKKTYNSLGKDLEKSRKERVKNA